MTRPARHLNQRERADQGRRLEHLGLGTQVRLHSLRGELECGLLDIAGVATWNDLADRITGQLPIVVGGATPNAFAPGAVVRAELLEHP